MSTCQQLLSARIDALEKRVMALESPCKPSIKGQFTEAVGVYVAYQQISTYVFLVRWRDRMAFVEEILGAVGNYPIGIAAYDIDSPGSAIVHEKLHNLGILAKITVTKRS